MADSTKSIESDRRPQGDTGTAARARNRSRRPSATSRDRGAWHAYLPVGVAFLSLIVAIYGLYSSRTAPEIALSMPDRVRVFNGSGGAGLYLQPRFVSTGSNERVEVITGLQVTFDPPGGGAPIVMRWDEQGMWTYDPASRALTWNFVADPAPLVVSRTAPQLPICLFVAPDGWRWLAGAYTVHIRAERKTNDAPLVDKVSFTISPGEAETLAASPRTFVEILTHPGG